MNFFGRSISFGEPSAVDIVIFDECNNEYVRRVLNAKYSFSIFRMRPHKILVSFSIIINALLCIHHFSLKYALFYPSGALRGVLFQLRAIYIESYLVSMKPKAVITFIDNSAIFHWLSRYSCKFPYIAIQNGARLRYAISENYGYYLQHYFCWGTHEAELFSQLGYQVERYYPVGSLLAGLALEQAVNKEIYDKYDLLIVSSWRGNIEFLPDVIDTMKSMKIMDEFLAKYLTSRSIRAAIILRAERDSEHWVIPGIGSEYDYYINIYGDALDIIEADFTARTIYPAMQESQLIVSCLSSALFEAYGFGKKVLFCNFTGKNVYHCDIENFLVINDINFDAFCKNLDNLLAQTKQSYAGQHQNSIRKYMNFPKENFTHDAIAKTIDEIIDDYQSRASKPCCLN